MFKAIACLLATASANRRNINSEYKNQLSGAEKITHDTFEDMYKDFTHQFESMSTSNDLVQRKQNFADNLEAIVAHNSLKTNTWTKGINKFSDMTHGEFLDLFSMKNVNEDQHCSATHERQNVDKIVAAVPDTWDWRDHNGVSPVKDQGSCGSCWTFSTVGALEAHELIKYKEFTSLAEQQLVDCAGAFDNHGCEGGLPSHAFEFIKYNGGIEAETSYPYHAVD